MRNPFGIGKEGQVGKLQYSKSSTRGSVNTQEARFMKAMGMVKKSRMTNLGLK